MIVDVPTLARPLTTSSFTDITPTPCLSVAWVDGKLVVDFAADLTPAEVEAVRARCLTGSANHEAVWRSAVNALAVNRAFIATSAPTQAQAVAQVKVLTQQVNALLRLVMGRFDGID